MTTNLQRRYPVGIQTFEKIIEGGYVYIDKTDLVWNLTRMSNYVFLSRPRRFGKSLLSSTLVSYFEGRRELFEGLKIGAGVGEVSRAASGHEQGQEPGERPRT